MGRSRSEGLLGKGGAEASTQDSATLEAAFHRRSHARRRTTLHGKRQIQSRCLGELSLERSWDFSAGQQCRKAAQEPGAEKRAVEMGHTAEARQRLAQRRKSAGLG